jgi:hypothetical protein
MHQHLGKSDASSQTQGSARPTMHETRTEKVPQKVRASTHVATANHSGNTDKPGSNQRQ